MKGTHEEVLLWLAGRFVPIATIRRIPGQTTLTLWKSLGYVFDLCG